MVVGNAAVAGLYGGVAALAGWMGNEKALFFLGLPSLFLTPLFGGFLASFVWNFAAPRIGQTVLASLAMTVTGLAGATVLFREGVICLIIVAPLYFGIVLAGALVGRLIFRADRTRLHLTIFPLLALLAAGEILTREDQVGVVTDEIRIQAPPDKVWPHITAFPTIPKPPEFWLFRLGLPYPQATTTEGDFVGARRECIFSGGAVFKEVIAEIEPEKLLTFDIVELPPDPELIGHLTPTRGRFTLRDNRDGTTTLTGDTWYVLHVRPLGYFDWWTHHIFRAVHLRVMEDIRRRAEASF